MKSNYFLWLGDAQENRTKEIKAARDIQRLWRGYNARKYIEWLNLQATDIKRVWRGYKGRIAANERKFYKVVEIESAFYNSTATLIQKVWKGYSSRKSIQDYYSRKKYINFVTGKALDLNEDVEAEMAGYTQYLSDQKAKKDAKEFEKLTASMHHLQSTFSQKGVFNSVYGEQYSTTAYGIPLEDHIHENTMNELQARKTMKRRLKSERKKMRSTMDATMEAKEQDMDYTNSSTRKGNLNVVR